MPTARLIKTLIRRRNTAINNKKLYRSRRNRIFLGICGGIGEYFGIDPTVVRVLWAVVSLLWGFGILLYIACMIIIPRKPSGYIEGEKVE